MNARTQQKPSAHAVFVARAISVACDVDAANDNAGAAWCDAFSKPYVDDYRQAIEVHDRSARMIGPLASQSLGEDLWIVYDTGTWGTPARVSFGPRAPASLAVRRIEKTVVELLRAAGLTVTRS